MLTELVLAVFTAIVTYWDNAPAFAVNERPRMVLPVEVPHVEVATSESWALDRPEAALPNENEEWFVAGVGTGHIKKVVMETGEITDFLTPKDFNPSLEDESVCTGSVPSEFVCGRVLGMKWDKRYKNLYIANAYFGIFKYEMETGELTKLHSGRKFYNDVVLDRKERKLYFTDSSTLSYRVGFLDVVVRNNRTGTLNEIDLRTGESRVVVGGIGFINGLARDGNWIYFADCNDNKIWRYHTKCSRLEIVLENLPVFPDNIDIDTRRKKLYIAGMKRSETMDWMLSTPEITQNLVKAPVLTYSGLFLQAIPNAGVVAVADYRRRRVEKLIIDEEGTIFSKTAAVHKHGDNFYVGSVVGAKAVKFTI